MDWKEEYSRKDIYLASNQPQHPICSLNPAKSKCWAHPGVVPNILHPQKMHIHRKQGQKDHMKESSQICQYYGFKEEMAYRLIPRSQEKNTPENRKT